MYTFDGIGTLLEKVSVKNLFKVPNSLWNLIFNTRFIHESNSQKCSNIIENVYSKKKFIYFYLFSLRPLNFATSAQDARSRDALYLLLKSHEFFIINAIMLHVENNNNTGRQKKKKWLSRLGSIFLFFFILKTLSICREKLPDYLARVATVWEIFAMFSNFFFLLLLLFKNKLFIAS